MSETAPQRTEMICPVVLRAGESGPEILAFKTADEAKALIVAPLEGDLTAREQAEKALLDISGLSPSGQSVDLGKSKGIEQGEAWQFFACPISGAPDSWSFQTSDSADVTFFWMNPGLYIDDDWHPVFIRAIRFVQGKVERMDATNRARILPAAEDTITNSILTAVAEAGKRNSVDPTTIARTLAGADEKEWRKMMKPIRAEAVRLAKNGQVVITRKGKAVDPDDFKGIYRIAGIEVSDTDQREDQT